MNGGFFPPHAGHAQGLDIDGSYPGYEQRDAAAADAMVALLQIYSQRVQEVWVTDKNGFLR
jgi:hypothetical protein